MPAASTFLCSNSYGDSGLYETLCKAGRKLLSNRAGREAYCVFEDLGFCRAVCKLLDRGRLGVPDGEHFFWGQLRCFQASVRRTEALRLRSCGTVPVLSASYRAASSSLRSVTCASKGTTKPVADTV